MKIAIIGYGVEGQAAYNYWHEGNDITVCDQNSALTFPDGVLTQTGKHYLANLEGFDIIVRSPFVRPQAIVAANSQAITGRITSCTNEFMRVSPSRNIIGVTGTKGKGTTASLITALLRASGKTVHLGGNIGVAALDLLTQNIQPDDWVVLELSSFQLIDLQHSPHLAVCLMVVPEHLDWHASFEEYATAKQQLFRYQTAQDIAVFYSANNSSTMIASVGQGQKMPYMQPPGAVVKNDAISIADIDICRVDELRLLGKHNWQNVCAALTVVWQMCQDVAVLHEALRQFSGLEHRLEFVCEIDGVKYYDDSFGTTPETAMVALAAFEQPKVIILGGSDKGADYTQLAQTVAGADIRKVLLIGDQAERLQQALDGVGFNDYQAGGTSMTEIVRRAQATSQAGDVVLLSTGCASFGMFKNYKDRGEQFKLAVQSLAAAGQ